MLFNHGDYKVIGSTYTITYPRYTDIRRDNTKIEDALRPKYLPPTVIPIPDEIEPGMPRVVLNSQNGHSNIQFSQIAVNLNVNYTSDYQKDYLLADQYLNQRISMIIQSLDSIGVKKKLYTGLTTMIQFPRQETDEEIINHIIDKFGHPDKIIGKISETNTKISFIVNGEYYINVVVGNYRKFDLYEQNVSFVNTLPMSEASASEKGIFIQLDINNRFLYNSTQKETSDVLGSSKLLLSFTKDFIQDKINNFLNEGVLSYD